jgi:hypothetical protein
VVVGVATLGDQAVLELDDFGDGMGFWPEAILGFGEVQARGNDAGAVDG